MFKTLRYSSMLKTVTLTIIINCSGDQSIETIFNEELENTLRAIRAEAFVEFKELDWKT